MIVAADLANFSEGLTQLANFIHLAQNHYPERLAFAVLSRPPTLFWLAWSAAQVRSKCELHVAHHMWKPLTLQSCSANANLEQGVVYKPARCSEMHCSLAIREVCCGACRPSWMRRRAQRSRWCTLTRSCKMCCCPSSSRHTCMKTWEGVCSDC